MSTSWQYDIRADLEWQPTEIRKVAQTGKGLGIWAEGEWQYRKDKPAVGPDGRQKGMEGALLPHMQTAGRPEYLHSAPTAISAP